MAGRTARPAPPPWERRLARHFREDAAAGSIISYAVGAAFFVLSSAFLLGFVVHPPGGAVSNLEYQVLRHRADDALTVLMGSPGTPSAWAVDAATVETVARLGLLQQGSTIRVDPLKFDALARGRFAVPSSLNGYVDYQEARIALGLEDYEFHLRAYPVFGDPDPETFGVTGMQDFRVAYVGHWSGVGWSASSQEEIETLDLLPIDFNANGATALLDPGDVFNDTSAELRAELVPLIGSSVDQTVISQGSGQVDYDFERVNGTILQGDFLVVPSGKVLALVDEDGNAGYKKSRELRAVLGIADLSAAGSVAAVSFAWNEWLDANDEGDYGWVEVSPDNGQTWIPMTQGTLQRSQDTTTSPQTPPNAWRARSELMSASCTTCAGNGQVLVALHWIADSDATIGKGWFVDDFRVLVNGAEVLDLNFDRPAYDLLVIGSAVSQSAFTPADVKYAIRDFVQQHGGRIIVLGGETNTNWLEPLFRVGMRDGSPGLASPDSTHPMLTVPNSLDWESYGTPATVWDFNGGDSELFNPVVQSASGHVLSVSKAGAFSGEPDEGKVILTTYMPGTFASDAERMRFIANAVTYGKYHYLYMEVGPEVPSNVPVASAVRTATMDKTRDGGGDYIEIAFVLYLWPGSTQAIVSGGYAIPPSAPQGLTAQTSGGIIWVNWSKPSVDGSRSLSKYDVYWGYSPESITSHLATVTPTDGTESFEAPASTYGWAYGTTYYFNVTANNTDRTSPPSAHASATPVTSPTAPQSFTAVALVGKVTLAWAAPASNGGAAVTGYRVWHKEGAGAYSALADVGLSTTYEHVTESSTATHSYLVQAFNSQWGPNSTEQSVVAVAGAGAPQAFSATPGSGAVTLAWSAPLDWGGGTPVGYRVYAGTASGALAAVADLAQTNVSFTHNDPGENETWFYQLVALSESGGSTGEGTRTGETSATTYAIPHPPALLSATRGSTGVSLAWSAPLQDGGTPVTSYRVWRAESLSGTWTDLTPAGVVTTSYADLTAGSASTYYYNVTAYNAVGASGPAVVAAPKTAPGAPQNLQATATPLVGEVTLTWSAPASDGGDAVTKYRVYAGTSPDPTALATEITMPATLSYLHTAPSVGQTWYYRVTAVSAQGEGAAATDAETA